LDIRTVKRRWPHVAVVLILVAALCAGYALWRRSAPRHQQRAYRIGYGNDIPFHFRDADGHPAGLAVEMIKEAAKRRGIQLEWVQPQEQGIPAVLKGDVDFWVLLTLRPERQKVLWITEPYLTAQNCFLILDRGKVTSLSELANARISFQDYDIHWRNLKALLPNFQPLTVNLTSDAVAALNDGRADAAYMDEFSASSELLAGGNRQHLRILSAPVPKSLMGLGASFAVKDVADEIREEVRLMEDDGSLVPLVQSWGFFPSLDAVENLSSERTKNRILTSGLVLLLIVVVLIGILAQRLWGERNAVKSAEEALRISENHYRSLVDLLPDPIYLAASDGRVLERGQLRVKGIDEAVLDRLLGSARYRENLSTAVRTKQVVVAEEKMPEGEVVEYRLVPLSDTKGATERVMGVLRDVTSTHAAEEDRRRLVTQLRALAARTESVLEQERMRIAREVHDELGQSLTALKLELGSLARRIDKGQAIEFLAADLSALGQSVDTIIKSVREIAMELRPGVLDSLGLDAAVEWRAEDFQKRSGIRCRLERLDPVVLDAGRATCLFRVLQEALTNVVRHAAATQVIISLEASKGSVELRVEDDGKGVHEVQAVSGLGVLGMKERVSQFGGTLLIEGRRNGGTRVRAVLPVAPVASLVLES
jgi:signal transduction histidine kinase/ABC-type amino acid transport substrate-binding protein